ncbi:unnamed protein product, partial [Porites evermanni]
TTPATASLDNRQAHLNTQLKLLTSAACMKNVLHAMQVLGILEKRLKAFGKKLVQFIFRPLILFPSLKPEVNDNKSETIVSFSKESGKKVIDPVSLYTKSSVVLAVLRKFFDGTSVKEEGEEARDNNVTSTALFSKLGEFLWPDLSEIIISECLKRSVPNTSAQLEKYQDIIKATEEFETKLVSFGLVPQGTDNLTLFVKDVGIHFGNKKCQDLLVAARDLMKDDIHNTVLVDSSADRAVLVSLGDVEKALQNVKGTKHEPLKKDAGSTLSKFTFHLPTCRISESTQKLMDLAYETLIEATQSTPQCGILLFYTVRNMFELYCNVVPTYHEKRLSTLPQLSALHHNNCMYIAHHLLTLSTHYPSYQHYTVKLNYVKLCYTMLYYVKLKVVKKQQSNLLELVKATEGFANAHEDAKGLQVEKTMKQIIHLLTYLGKIWNGILPVDIYCQSLGCLFDDVFQRITWEILQLEDISSEEAHQLHTLLSILEQRGSEIFQNKDTDSTENTWDICTVVPHWIRYKELIGILEASLQDIVDRWAEGKGPLAHEFSAQEVRGLIRALFQNTDRRAAVLAKIKPLQG